MDQRSTAEKVPQPDVVPSHPQPAEIIINIGGKKFKVVLLAIFLLLLLAVGVIAGTHVVSLLRGSVNDDCDVGPWGSWTSCQLPPGRCGTGSKNRTREKLADAQNQGEKCAKLRIIEVAEILSCNVECTAPVDCKVGSWGSWSNSLLLVVEAP